MIARSLLAAVLLCACGRHHHAGPDAADDGGFVPDACVGLQCSQVDCGAKNLPPTSLSGTVYAPNGTLPLYGVTVYVPASDPGPLSPNLVCDQCTATLPGGALAATQTDEAGHFELDDVPATGDVPVVIQVGKWRRQLRIPNVAACQDLPVALADTSLPKSYKDASPLTDVDATGAPKVDMPKIAISTGDADALECLPLKLGVDPSEITNDVGPGHVHLYTNKDSGGQGTNKFTTNWPGSVDPNGDAFGDAETMWGNNAPTTPDHLASYDIVMFSCEGGQFPATKKQSSLDGSRRTPTRAAACS